MLKNIFKLPRLTLGEVCLWISSMVVMILGYVIAPENGLLNFIASLIGATSLIFIARGAVIGQILMVVFCILYGVISFDVKYYGEMITYVAMSLPMAVFSVISWLGNPFEKSSEVKVNCVSGKIWAILSVLTAAVTLIFYFILGALNTVNLPVSTISVSTSFIAAALTFLRSPYYALGYAANDIVLIILWVYMSLSDRSCLVMVACFTMFLLNDLYGFISWKKMQKRQRR